MFASSTLFAVLLTIATSVSSISAAPLSNPFGSTDHGLEVARRQYGTTTRSYYSSYTPTATPSASATGGAGGYGYGYGESETESKEIHEVLELASKAEIKLTFACTLNTTSSQQGTGAGTRLVDLQWAAQDFRGVKYVFVTDQETDVTKVAVLTKLRPGVGTIVLPNDIKGPILTLGVANVTEPTDKLLANSICIMNAGGLVHHTTTA